MAALNTPQKGHEPHCPTHAVASGQQSADQSAPAGHNTVHTPSKTIPVPGGGAKHQPEHHAVDSGHVDMSGALDSVQETVVTPDPTDFSMRHPLQHMWTMWYDPPRKGRVNLHNWQANVKKIMDFDSVEDFWCMFNNLAAPSRLAHGCNYHLFKHGIHPSWEDPWNMKGGKWVMSVADEKQLNELWENTVLAVIGEMFDFPDEICGAVVSLRNKRNRLALWTRTAINEPITKRIGAQWKVLVETDCKLEYQVHADALQTSSSFANEPRYRV